MIRNRLYYRIKPIVPAPLRLAVRRWFAVRKRARVRNAWPIIPGSEKRPEGWPGWPDGKKFAFVLTHDVEGSVGLDKCRQLMEVEMKLGFRSSFNFIPEGEYSVPRALRDELRSNGFEVGVHDLKHDGNLYRSRDQFRRSADQINQYIKEWGVTGFRSGSMFHNLEWLHDLNISYDASTFDTDPFEPQPDGVNTIFPFWVPRPHAESAARNSKVEAFDPKNGYVELPYTLPQDSTLFLLLGERLPEIWFRKLDWIVQHGGMVLLDTHPDYMTMNGARARRWEYPVQLYQQLLEYVRSNYPGSYWHTTPNELARWYRTVYSPVPKDTGKPKDKDRPLKGKRAAVVLYSYYLSDPRPRREAEALAAAGMEIDLICLRHNADEPTRERVNGVNIRRVPIKRRRDGKLTYVAQYAFFVAWCAAALAVRSLRKRYDLVHAHNMPDILVFSGIIPKLRGAQVILDLHDPMPELMITIFGLRENSFSVKLLKLLERLSIRFADRVLTVNLACKKIFASRSCPPEKITVVMNVPDEDIFGFLPFENAETPNSSKPFVIMYHGSIVERHGLDLAFRALEIVKKTVPNAELRIYGSRNSFLDSLLDSIRNNGLHHRVHYFGAKSLDGIVEAIAQCDVGVIPNRRSIFTEINTPTRIFEYLSRGKPVIAPRAPGIVDYFGKDDLVFFELGDAEDLARKIEYVYSHPAEVRQTVQRGQEVYLGQRWTRKKSEFVNVARELLGAPAGGINRE